MKDVSICRSSEVCSKIHNLYENGREKPEQNDLGLTLTVDNQKEWGKEDF